MKEELKLSDAQIAKIKELTQRGREIVDEAKKKGDAISKEEVKKKLREVFGAVKNALKPEQFRRMEQLQMQQVGPAIFFTPLVARKVELSDEQKSKIEAIYKQSSKGRFELYRKSDQKRMAEVDKGITSEILETLNEDQKNKFKELIGEPFNGKLPPADFFPFEPWTTSFLSPIGGHAYLTVAAWK